MVSTPMIEGIMIVASITIAAILSGAVISKVYSIESMLSQISILERINAQIRLRLTYVACISNTSFVAYIKNTGLSPVNLSAIDLLLGSPGSEAPLWLLGGSMTIQTLSGSKTLQPGELGVINITLATPIQSRVVSIRVIYPNGVSEYSVCSW